jgi:hypothetical protein
MYRRGTSGMGDGDETAPVGEPAAEEQSDEHVKAFFLDLAAKGKEAWNEWRRNPANERERATFAGVDFSKAPLDTIDFSSFEFGHWADFSGCVWRGVAWQFGGDWERGYGMGIICGRPHGKHFFCAERFGRLRSYVRPDCAAHMSAGPRMRALKSSSDFRSRVNSDFGDRGAPLPTSYPVGFAIPDHDPGIREREFQAAVPI